MWYQSRAELDKISLASVYHYDNGENYVVRLNGSFWLEVERDDDAFTPPVLRTGNWEAWNAVAIMDELHHRQENPQFFDVGANVGYYTMMVASAGFPTSCFEPNPNVMALLERSLELNNLDGKVHCGTYGIGETEDTLILSKVDKHSGANSLAAGATEGIEVQVKTLDMHRRLVNQPYVIKVDVEGFEREVWNGAKEIRKAKQNTWFVEWVPSRHGREYNLEWLNEVIKTHDLQMVNHDGSLRPVGIDEALAVTFETIVFRKRLK